MAGSSAPSASRDYARGARILSVGIAATGLFTFAFFAVASHVLPEDEYGQLSLLWSMLFVVLSVIYRPVEQLLSRSIADRRARGISGHPLRVPVLIQAAFALTFLVLALALRGPIEDLFDGNGTLFWILVVAALAYAASYFARGYVAGHQWFGLYGGLVLFESVSRFLLPRRRRRRASRRARRRSPWASPPRRSRRCSSSRGRSRGASAATARSSPVGRCARAAASPAASRRSSSPSRPC